VQKRKSLFDRVGLEEVLKIVAQQNDDSRDAGKDSERPNGAHNLRSTKAENSKNVQKKKAQPKRSIESPGDDHEVGLWIDYDLLRKHQSQVPQIVIHDPVSATNNRYLALADIALRGGKPKKRSRYRLAE